MAYNERIWVNVPPGQAPPPGALAMSAENLSALEADVKDAVTVVPRLHTDWTRQSDGPMGGVGDEGAPFVIPTTGTTVVPTVSGGKLVCDMTSSPGAVYVNQQLPGKLKRIGAVFGIGPGAAGSAAALIAWTDINMAGGVPDTHCHLTIGPTSWGFDIWQGQVSSSLIFEALPVALAQDYRPYRAEVSFDNDTATISLPNGLVRKVVDPRIASINGAAASWEFYQPAATAPLAFYQTWADTFPTVPGSVNEQRSAEIAGANAPPSVTASVFGKVDYQLYPFPTSSGIIDAAVAVTGSRGPTGGVLIDVEAPIIMTNATSYVWEIHIDGGYGVGIVVLAQPFTGFLKKRFVLTGLSAGNHSFLLRHWQVDALANNSIEVWNAQGKKILMSATPI